MWFVNVLMLDDQLCYKTHMVRQYFDDQSSIMLQNQYGSSMFSCSMTNYAIKHIWFVNTLMLNHQLCYKANMVPQRLDAQSPIML